MLHSHDHLPFKTHGRDVPVYFLLVYGVASKFPDILWSLIHWSCFWYGLRDRDLDSAFYMWNPDLLTTFVEEGVFTPLCVFGSYVDSSALALLHSKCPQLATHCQEPATTHRSAPQAPGFAICRHQEASLPTDHGDPHPSQSLIATEPLLPQQRLKMPDILLRRGKLKSPTLHMVW
jgi:hypothetical protein